MTYSSEVLADSPYAYWRFSETSGATAADSSGNARTATWTGTYTRNATGLVPSDSSDPAVSVSGAGYADVPYGTWLNSANLTLEAIIKPSAIGPNAMAIEDRDNGGSARCFQFNVNSSGKLQLIWWTTSGGPYFANGATTLVAGNTYHVAAILDGSSARLLVNGVVDGTTTQSGNAQTHGSQPIRIATAADSGLSNKFYGTIDEVAYYGTALTTTRIAAHYAAITAPTSFTGSVNAMASAPTVSVAGSITTPTTGTVAVTASAPTVSITGNAPTVGTVIAAASAPTVLVSGNVAGITSGTVQATASAPTVSITGDVPTVITGTVNATASAPSVKVSDSTTGAQIAVGVKIEVGALTLADVVTLDGTDLAVGIGITVGTSLVIEPLEGTEIAVGMSLIGRPVPFAVPDPRTGREQWRYVVTDLQGVPVGELVDITHDPVEDGVNEMAAMSFTIGMDDPDRAMIQPYSGQCQIWQGDTLLLRGPFDAGRADDEGATITYQVSDPSWWWRNGRGLIGRTPALNLLRNGDFNQALNYWTPGHDADSIPAANPTVRVVPDTFTGPNGHAAEIVGVESVTITESELSSNAVFWPNLATFRPGGVASIEAVANAMPTTPGLKVLVVGHTANDGTGPGFDLSRRRAEAAAAIIHGKRPAAVITTRGVGYTDPKPGYPIDSQAQRRVVISYESTTTISAKSKQWIRQTVEVTQPKAAAYPLVMAAAAWLKVTDDWSVADANMVSIKVVARRKSAPSKPWDDQKGVAEVSISDTDPVNRWMKETAEVIIPADGRPYLVDVYLYAPAALARYTRAMLQPQEILYFWGVDQALIVKGIVEHMQLPLNKMGRTWPITVGTRTPLTGVTRDKSYAYSERMPVDTALDGLMSLYNGLDIDVLPHPTETTVTTFYPKQGQVVDYVLVQGGNVVRAVPATTNDVGSLVIAQAQDSSAVRDEAYAIDPKAFGGMIAHRLITAEQDTPISELDETAAAELHWSKVTTPSWWLDVEPDSAGEVLASTRKGDTVRVILDAPIMVDALARIVKRQNHPDGLRLMVALEEA